MKSSIGDFLAILRKSKGLTQQEVADRLGVSNKTVSSWETGASCPDISMLPAIAELFDVTCDELLRGERISSAEPPPRTEEKREKALGRMLAMYRNNAAATSWICGALYAVAIIATLLIGCAAFESLIGFFVGLIFIVGAVFLCVIQLRYLRFQRFVLFTAGSGSHQIFLSALKQPIDIFQLRNRLSRTVNHLAKAASQTPVVVNFRTADILIGKLYQLLFRLFDGYGAHLHFLQQFLYLHRIILSFCHYIIVHDRL